MVLLHFSRRVSFSLLFRHLLTSSYFLRSKPNVQKRVFLRQNAFSFLLRLHICPNTAQNEIIMGVFTIGHKNEELSCRKMESVPAGLGNGISTAKWPQVTVTTTPLNLISVWYTQRGYGTQFVLFDVCAFIARFDKVIDLSIIHKCFITVTDGEYAVENAHNTEESIQQRNNFWVEKRMYKPENMNKFSESTSFLGWKNL